MQSIGIIRRPKREPVEDEPEASCPKFAKCESAANACTTTADIKCEAAECKEEGGTVCLALFKRVPDLVVFKADVLFQNATSSRWSSQPNNNKQGEAAGLVDYGSSSGSDSDS